MIIVFILFLLVYPFATFPYIGKILDYRGKVDIIDILTGKPVVFKKGSSISNGVQIRTGYNSYAIIRLYPSQKVILFSRGVLRIKYSFKKDYFIINHLYGKLRYVSGDKKKTVYLTTISSIVEPLGTDIGIITTQKETRVISFMGYIKVSSSDPTIRISYLLYPFQETVVLKGRQPAKPRTLKSMSPASWFRAYLIDEDDRIVLIGDIKEKDVSSGESLIDFILRRTR